MLILTEAEFAALAGLPAPPTEQSRRGRGNRAAGAAFEERILAACRLYREQGQAMIEKTPEPMRPLRRLGGGRFEACFVQRAQPDFRGTLVGGRAVAFEAKATEGTRIARGRVTETQAAFLRENEALGGVSFVLVQFGSGQVYRIPWALWEQMPAAFGRASLTEVEAAGWRCPLTPSGVPLFLREEETNGQ